MPDGGVRCAESNVHSCNFKFVFWSRLHRRCEFTLKFRCMKSPQIRCPTKYFDAIFPSFRFRWMFNRKNATYRKPLSPSLHHHRRQHQNGRAIKSERIPCRRRRLLSLTYHMCHGDLLHSHFEKVLKLAKFGDGDDGNPVRSACNVPHEYEKCIENARVSQRYFISLLCHFGIGIYLCTLLTLFDVEKIEEEEVILLYIFFRFAFIVHQFTSTTTTARP